MSVTSPASDDSNAERDHEYAADDYLTDPEIVFTPETKFDAEPRMGQEAESRFAPGAEASTLASIDVDLFDKGLLCPHAHYFSGKPGEYEAFCHKYGIPDDVLLTRVKSDEIRDKKEDHPEHITVPLMAICEAGLRLPLHPFLREILWKFSLAPHQLAINSYRIIMSVITLVESQGLDFKVNDLFHTYTMSRHGRTGCRFLTTRSKKSSLIEGLSDTDKWADFYVEVHGNYEFGGTHRRYSVPKVSDKRGNAEPSSLLVICYLHLLCR